MIDDIIEWGWHEAPARRLIFARDVPRLPAGALLLLRATGMRIGELLDLELDCVHEVPGAGAWLKVPLGSWTPSGWGKTRAE